VLGPQILKVVYCSEKSSKRQLELIVLPAFRKNILDFGFDKVLRFLMFAGSLILSELHTF